MASTLTRTIEQARREAVRQGARSLEAEHLLLALAREPDVAEVLRHAGWDEDGLRRALHEEWVASLAAAGIEWDIPAPGVPDLTASPRVGESFKQALARGVTVGKLHRARRMRPAHLLHGVLSAQHGTVPRALTPAGVDALKEQLERTF